MSRFLTAGEYRAMPWKNGGGETFEILISPPDASFDDLDWRISMAQVGEDGPFSALPGLDRTLAVLEGGALTLSDSQGSVRLTPASSPFSFEGEREITGKVEGGPIMDLNVMTRRGRMRHSVRRLCLAGKTNLQPDRSAFLLVFALEKGLVISGQLLGVHDAVLIAASDTPQRATNEGAVNALIVEIYAEDQKLF